MTRLFQWHYTMRPWPMSHFRFLDCAGGPFHSNSPFCVQICSVSNRSVTPGWDNPISPALTSLGYKIVYSTPLIRANRNASITEWYYTRLLFWYFCVLFVWVTYLNVMTLLYGISAACYLTAWDKPDCFSSFKRAVQNHKRVARWKFPLSTCSHHVQHPSLFSVH